MESAKRLLLALLFLNSCTPSSHPTQNVEVALISEAASIQPGKPFEVGLRMTMREGWHTYWKNPGDSGLPLRIEWTLPPGFSAGPIEWPAPDRFMTSDLVSYGYHGVVLLPVRIVPPAELRGRSVTLRGAFRWLECADVCVPGSDTLEITLAVRSPSSASRWAREFETARARMPATPVGWSFSTAAGESTIALAFRPPRGFAVETAYFFADSPLVVDYAAPQRLERTPGGFRLTIVAAPNAPAPATRLTGVLAVEHRKEPASRTAVQIEVPVAVAGAGASGAGTGAPATSSR